MSEPVRAFGYICPSCGKSVYGERTHFALRAAAAGLVCGCGGSELTAEPYNGHYRVTTPCGVCGGEHRAEIPARQVLEGQGVGLACPETKQLCCYIGEADRVQRALQELEITVKKQKAEKDSVFTDDIIMYEVLSELKEIAARGGITCTCGSGKCAVEVHGSSIDLICPSCGGCLRIPAATDEDLDRLCCQYTLTVPGNKRDG